MDAQPTNTDKSESPFEAQWRSKKRPKKRVQRQQARLFDKSVSSLVCFQFAIFIMAFFQILPAVIGIALCVSTVSLFAIAVYALDLKTNPSQTSNHQSLKSQDLSERLEMLEDQSWEIRESEDIHRSAAEAFGDIVIHRNAMGEITFSNSVYEKYFEHPSQLPGFAIDMSKDHQRSTVRDVEIATKIGPRWFAWTDLIIRDFETGASGTRSIGRDITERKKYEQSLKEKATEAHQVSNAKTRFLGMMSHEIRTPLSGILGMTKLLNESDLTSSQSSHLKAIETSSRTLLELVEDLLDQAQLDTGHMVIAKNPTNLVRLVEDVCELLGDRARQKNIMITSHIDARLAASVELDGPRLKQVLVNLAGNALKFTETGGVAIDVMIEQSDGTNTPIMSVSVKDSGPGIAGQDLDKIFNAFAQVDSGSNRTYEGAGLGLAISQDLVRLMGGKITVESKINNGTVFQFKLPLTPECITDPSDEKVDCVILAMPSTPARDALTKTAYQFSRKVITANSTDNLEIIASTCPKNTVVIVDDAFSISESWAMNIRGILGQDSRLIRLEPAQGTTPIALDDIFDGWLTWPVRSESLKNALFGVHRIEDENMIRLEQQNEKGIAPTLGRSLHVLLAEDNPINTLLATSLLGKLGHRVTHAEDGEKAYEFFVRGQSNSPFDVILMDLHMPQCDGVTAIRSIRKHEMNMDISKTPIVVLSADNQDSAQTEALHAGADDFLLKPLDFVNVANILNAIDTSEIETLSTITR